MCTWQAHSVAHSLWLLAEQHYSRTLARSSWDVTAGVNDAGSLSGLIAAARRNTSVPQTGRAEVADPFGGGWEFGGGDFDDVDGAVEDGPEFLSEANAALDADLRVCVCVHARASCIARMHVSAVT